MSDIHGQFPCSQCGECCRRVNLLSETARLDRGDGVCMHFDEQERLCRIYLERPLICRVDLQFDRNYRHIMTWDAFVDLNQKACRRLQDSQVEGGEGQDT